MNSTMLDRRNGKAPRRAALAFALAILFCGPQPSLAGTPALEQRIEFTTLVVAPVISPRPVAGADGRTHLAYELSFVNETRLITRVDAIETLDADTGAVVARWRGDALAAVFRLNANEPGTALAPAHSGYAFLDVAVPAGAPTPRALRHRIATTRFQVAPGGDEHKAAPLDPKLGLPASVIFEGVETAWTATRRSLSIPRCADRIGSRSMAAATN